MENGNVIDPQNPPNHLGPNPKRRNKEIRRLANYILEYYKGKYLTANEKFPDGMSAVTAIIEIDQEKQRELEQAMKTVEHDSRTIRRYNAVQSVLINAPWWFKLTGTYKKLKKVEMEQ